LEDRSTVLIVENSIIAISYFAWMPAFFGALLAEAEVQARVAELARKCNEGELIREERQEYETYVMAGEFLAILHARARIILARHGQSS
jgi:hypothetical protein